jgi:hypothetical protein
MAMTDGYDGMTAIQIQILRSFAVPHVAAFSFYDLYIEKRIYIK